VIVFTALVAAIGIGLQSASIGEGTQIVFLGSGSPNPDPEHQGPALAIIVHGQPYIVDCGAGLVRQASAAHAKGFTSLTMERLTRAFVTHLHSDHTIGLPDLMFTPAVTGRKEGLELIGPPGLAAMTKHIEEAWSEDRDVRFYGGEPAVPKAYEVHVHEIDKDGIVYEDANVKVRAFSVNHGKWLHAYGYRFETPDRVIVVSGDTTYCPNLIANAKGCDVLIHEAYSAEGLRHRTPEWQAYHASYHTSGPDVGRIANALKPKLVLLYHELPFGQPDGEILREVQSVYGGDVREAKDLEGY
jgi:ribonuclease BN (tRNA processing enzyme)